MPRVSAVVPVFNRALCAPAAVSSLLSQTYENLEVIIVDDGSTDGSVPAVEALGDPRIRIVRHAANQGIPHARNAGLDAARGEFVAWLDSDDIARPTRLRHQLAFLDAHPEVAFVGSCAGTLDANGRRRWGVRVPPLEHEDITAWLLFRSAFQNSAIVGRTDLFRRYRYDPEFPVCEDIDVFQRLTANHRSANLPLPLIDRRLHKGQIIRQRAADIQRLKGVLFTRQMASLGVHADADDIARHVQLGSPKLAVVPADLDYLRWAREWLDRIVRANGKSRRVDERCLMLACAFFWTRACVEAGINVGWSGAGRLFATSEPSRWLGVQRGRRWIGKMVAIRAASLLAG